MTPDDFIETIIRNRQLTTQGFGVYDGSDETFEDERGNLAEYYKEANICESFLKQCSRTKSPNKAAGSTKDLIHEIERHSSSPRIREGALILAAIHLGFQMKRVRDRTSVYLNISEMLDAEGVSSPVPNVDGVGPPELLPFPNKCPRRHNNCSYIQDPLERAEYS